MHILCTNDTHKSVLWGAVGFEYFWKGEAGAVARLVDRGGAWATQVLVK